MNITNEEKAKVFAMYVDQQVVFNCKGEDIVCKIVNIGLNSMYATGKAKDGNTFNAYGFFDGKLLLTPLSDITDEDAIDVANICWYIKDDDHYNSGSPETTYYIMRVKDEVLKSSLMIYSHYQYLISKGYAVPLWFGIDHWANGKTAIELGIATSLTP